MGCQRVWINRRWWEHNKQKWYCILTKIGELWKLLRAKYHQNWMWSRTLCLHRWYWKIVSMRWKSSRSAWNWNHESREQTRSRKWHQGSHHLSSYRTSSFCSSYQPRQSLCNGLKLEWRARSWWRVWRPAMAYPSLRASIHQYHWHQSRCLLCSFIKWKSVLCMG